MKYNKENDYYVEVGQMFELIERDHGGCDDEECSLYYLLNDPSASMEEVIHWWACSGAADRQFDRLYIKHEQKIKHLLGE